MLKLITISAAALAVAVAATGIAEEQTTQPANARSYQFTAGQAAEYECKASLAMSGDAKKDDKSDFRAKFTVLDAAGGNTTLFTALDPGDTQSSSSRGSDLHLRYTFQLSGEGEVGEQKAGVYGQPLQFVTPLYFFPPLNATGDQMDIQLPMSGEHAKAKIVGKTTQKDGTIEYKLSYAPTGPAGENNNGMAFKSYDATLSRDPKLPWLKSITVEFAATISDMTGKEAQVKGSFSAKQLAASTLAASDLAALRKDVAAGVKAFTELQGSAGMGGVDPDSLKQLDAYVQDNPSGQFAKTFTAISKELQLQVKLQENSSKLQEGKPAPIFQAQTIDGQTVRLSDLKGKVVLLDFWATWCGPCVAEIPNVKQVYEDNRAKGFTVIGISADRELDDLQTFIKAHGIEWKQIFEPETPEGSVRMTYGVMQFPTTVLIDREGTIRLIGARGMDLEQAVKDLVQAK